uniref:Uncharacterized protein n=1 Tax=Nelumbo nucifera TaxID=4432 RepID=A0A822ZN86_NELNU|nr:TPA_asm: hypothetical protein HUJ06_016629 [Nelumbo nucifera]
MNILLGVALQMKSLLVVRDNMIRTVVSEYFFLQESNQILDNSFFFFGK